LGFSASRSHSGRGANAATTFVVWVPHETIALAGDGDEALSGPDSKAIFGQRDCIRGVDHDSGGARSAVMGERTARR